MVADHNKTLPKTLLKYFKDISEDASGDVFGKVYEYFLAEFALAEGQGGGEFFTPISVIKLMVEIIEPYQYGIPQNKTKSSSKNKEKEVDTVPNANYLWISLFATLLKPTGRAALAMANSASDARNSEAEIHKNLIKSGVIDPMLTLPKNMFYTVTLPATLWFFDKSKTGSFSSPAEGRKEGTVLFIDARNIFRQVTRALQEFTTEHIQNIATIVRLYRGETERLTKLLKKHEQQANAYEAEATEHENIVLKTASVYEKAKADWGNLQEKITAAQGDAKQPKAEQSKTAAILNKAQKEKDEAEKLHREASDKAVYYQAHINWRNERFPRFYHAFSNPFLIAKHVYLL